ncbi:aminoglycoside phosphotransferase family protein [Micromonospora sp. IBHARD004]|uniref:aminoglycoside phosphotransferase family protein n=1 Tax=Micromonospora sp. IBHARD004 TaxID=3457764 RepID=UPI004058B4C2
MHADQVDITADVVTALVGAQFPHWRADPVRPVVSYGTVNTLFRLGDEIALRFPLRPSLDAALRDELVAEQDHARRIATHVPVAVPEPIAVGEPGPGYAGPWTAYRWIPGEPADRRTISGPRVFAADLAAFVAAVHDMETGGRTWDGRGRGGPLHTRDAYVRWALGESTHLTDTARLARTWAECRDAAPHDGPDVWLHGDLMPGNLLVRDGRLAAVIDLGAVGVGDPAVDLMPAWNLLPVDARDTYRRALGVDDATWQRGRGWALVQAIGALAYYVGTNPVMADTARRTLDALLE